MTDNPTEIAPQPGIMGITPYVGGSSHIEGVAKVIKLASNENPFGPSPAAIAAYKAAGDDLASYPSPDCGDLRAAIGAQHGIDPARILCGNGSDELIALLCMAYAGEGQEVLFPDHSFALYGLAAQANGCTPIAAPDTDLTPDVDNLLAACTDQTRLVFLANPNNPTGTRLNAQEVDRLAAGLPPKALLVVDAAYAEFVTGDDYDSGQALVSRRENVVMTRTLSKIYGLAALRLGWLYGPAHVIDVLNRVRGPFNVNAAAQAAAMAAVNDGDYVAWCIAKNVELKAKVVKALEGLGLPSIPSSANFILTEFGTGKDTGAAAADAFLKSKGVIIRRMDGYGLPEYLRISIGTDEECAALIAVLTEFRGPA
jgi:histidinol-phosphate aminotransferase